MSKLYNDSVQVASEKIQWQRDEVAAKIVDFEQARDKHSQRQFAIEQGVSRSTLQHWLARKESIDASPVLIEFLESPIGTAFVHRIVTAAFDGELPCGELHRIQGDTIPGNKASESVLEKVGFKEEGLRRHSGYWKNKFHDLKCFGLIKTDHSEI